MTKELCCSSEKLFAWLTIKFVISLRLFDNMAIRFYRNAVINAPLTLWRNKKIHHYSIVARQSFFLRHLLSEEYPASFYLSNRVSGSIPKITFTSFSVYLVINVFRSIVIPWNSSLFMIFQTLQKTSLVHPNSLCFLASQKDPA